MTGSPSEAWGNSSIILHQLFKNTSLSLLDCYHTKKGLAELSLSSNNEGGKLFFKGSLIVIYFCVSFVISLVLSGKAVRILDKNSWPSAEDLELDSSQLRAVQAGPDQ